MEGAPSSMEVEQSRAYIDDLYSNDPKICLNAASELKFQVIGSAREKMSIVEQGVVARLLQILRAPDSSVELKTEVTIILNSLAKGLLEQSVALVQAGLLPALWEQLEICGSSSNSQLTKRILCCLRSIYQQGCVPPPPAWNLKLLTTLIQYGYSPPDNQECVANILAHACKTKDQQQQLVDAGAGELVACMLCSTIKKVQLPALHCLAALCYKNEVVAKRLKLMNYKGRNVLDLATELMSRDVPKEMQLAAATCLTFLHRAGAIQASDTKISFKTLQCLVRLCKKDCNVFERVEAAHRLAYLTEVSVELQKTASITDHLPAILVEYLDYQVDLTVYQEPLRAISPVSPRKYDNASLWPQLMREAAIKVYSSLSANDESIRKLVIEMEGLMTTLVASLNEGTLEEQMASVRCLHSLSRSVQTLRTSFQDHTIWKPLMAIIKDSNNEEFISVASSTLCNLILEFSPSKEFILDQGAIEFLCNLTRKQRASLRLNAVWALMNMAFQTDHKVKTAILTHLGTEQIFNLLGDSDVNVLMKTLGLLRNLLSSAAHIDQIMQSHGKEIMQGIIMVLENEHTSEVKEQTLCILANIADGGEAKASIMSNEDILKKLMNYMVMPNIKLQIAATFCISNLVDNKNGDAGAVARQVRMREMGVDKILEGLLSTTDSNLFDIVKLSFDQLRTPTTWSQ